MNDDIETTLRDDPVMDRLIDRHGPITVEPAADEFRRLCVSIINQQLSTASADAIRGRVVDLLGEAFAPADVLAADEAALRETGLSRTKVEYLRNVAEAFRERDLTREALADRSDDEVIEELTAIKGVGPWSARMYLLFALGREDVLPLGDLGIRQGIQQLYADGRELDRTEMREIADRWQPYRSYGTRYVWLEYEN